MAEPTTPPQPAHDPHSLQRENERLRAALAELQSRLQEPEEIVRAIRYGEVDAFVVNEPLGERIYALRSPDLLYKQLIEEMQEGALAIDEDGVILYSNRHFAELVKKPRESLRGADIFAFVPPEGRAALDSLRRPDDQEARRQEVSLLAADGSLVPAQLTISPIQLDNIVVYCLVVTDLTEQKREQELLSAAHRKDVFLAMLSHELRNPIAPIRNAAHVLRLENISPKDVHWAADVVERQVVQLSRLVDDLLDVARINSGKIRLRLEAVDLRGVVTAAVEETRPAIDARQQELHVDVPAGPLVLQGDAARLTQVLANLLSNAAKFTPRQGKISIVAERQGSECVVRVRDSGVGIDPEMLPSIFDIFTQADTTEGRSHGGLGIGLALVKTLIEMHGGQVGAESGGPGRGAEFSIRLPLLKDQQNRLPAPASQPLPPHRPCCVLVVDDNRDSAESMARLIRQWGHDVHVAFTPQKGLEAARTHRPRVVLLDIGMPGMDGYEVGRQMRRLPGLDGAVFVAVTGYGQDDDRRRTREAGFNHHWVKPASLDAVETLLRSLGG
jgi:PAS domain S-box-containing protein